jgi:regulatory protein
MPQITKIKSQKINKRVNIYLDGKYAFPLDLNNFVKAGLKVGQKLSEKEVEALKEKDLKEKIFNKVLKFLSYRPRSEKEIVDYLKKKGASSTLIDKSIKKLKKLKFLNDRDFVTWWLEQRSTFRPRGKRALKMELIRKGIDREIIDEVLNKAVDELVLAKKAAQKKLKTYQRLEANEFRKKMTGYLARQGFAWDSIKEALEEIDKKR